MTKFKKFQVIVAISTTIAATLDVGAVPFFNQRLRGTQPTIRSESGLQSGVMTGYSVEVQSGVSDFVFLARNFAGGNTNTNNRSPSGLIGPVADPIDIVTPAPSPGSASLMLLGAALLLWRRRSR